MDWGLLNNQLGVILGIITIIVLIIKVWNAYNKIDDLSKQFNELEAKINKSDKEIIKIDKEVTIINTNLENQKYLIETITTLTTEKGRTRSNEEFNIRRSRFK